MNTTEHTLHLPTTEWQQIFDDRDYDAANDLQSIFRQVGEWRLKGCRATAKRINGKLTITVGVL